MRQFKTIILFLSVLVLSAACQKDKYELDIPEAGVRLGFPVEGATLNLNDESVTSFTFSWDKVCEETRWFLVHLLIYWVIPY